jgi:hypothetical protein
VIPETEEAVVQALSVDTPVHERMDLVDELGNAKGSLSNNFVEKLLVRVLNEDPSAIVRHEAAFILGSLHRDRKPLDTASIDALCEAAVHDPSGVVRHEAAEALGCIPELRVRNVLERLLGDLNEDVVETARIGLERHDHCWKRRPK